jgi:crotonobetainyl-CoA:carnitine CoA-transferase CaiB-like acyl-CoA transferase
VMDNLGIGYEKLKAENPRLVYCAISGFGQDGPRAHLPAFDHVIQGYSGWMSITGDAAHGPSRAGPSVGDLMSGLFATIGTISALHARTQTGRGQRVTTSLLEALIATLMPHQSAYFGTGEAPKAEGNAHPIIVPFGTYGTADGHMNVAVATAKQWQELCAALGIARLGDDPDYASNAGRAKHRTEIEDAIAAALKAATSNDWLQRFNDIGIPCAPVNNIPQALGDPQSRHNEAVVAMQHPTAGRVETVNHPIRMERTPASEWRAPPTLGQHTKEILARVGVGEPELAALKTKGVI